MHVVLPEFRRMPSSRDLRAILEKYVRPLTEEQVQGVERRLREVLESQTLHTTEADQFYGNSQVWAGRLFLEEAKVPRTPSVSSRRASWLRRSPARRCSSSAGAIRTGST